MARPTLNDIRQLADFQTLFRWSVTFHGGPFGTNDSGYNVRCETSSIPKTTNNTYEVNIRGHKSIQNGIMTYDNSYTLTFLETVDNKIKKLFKSWKESLWSTEIGVASKPTKELKTTIFLELLNNQDQIVATYTLYGVLLQDYDMGNLDGSSSDAMRPSATFTYDYFTETFV